MSYQAVNAVLTNSKAKGSDRLVLVVLASHADEKTFECYPGRDLLCKEAAMSERNLIYCLKKLEEASELTISRGTGRGNLTTYRINLPKVKEVERVQQVAPFSEPERVQDSVETVQQPSPFEIEKGCNPASERVQPTVKRVQDSVIKGAKSGNAYKDIEPSWNYEETIMEEKKDMSGALAPAVPSPVLEVFSYWQSRLNHPKSKLTPERQKKIKARLKDYTLEDIKQAIDGCASSPFHMGQSPGSDGTIHDDIELICRDGKHVEMFISKVNGRNCNGALNHFSPAGQQTIAAADAWLKRTQEKGQL